MKKALRFFYVAALVFQFVASNGQESSFRIGIGYAVPTGSQILDQEYAAPLFTKANMSTTHYRAVSSAFGKGLNLGISYTKMFSTHFGIEINGNFQSGTSQVDWLFPDVASTLEANKQNAYNSEGQSTSYSTGYSLSPMGIFRINANSNIQPYVKAGVLFGSMNRISNSTERNTDAASKISSLTEIAHFSNGTTHGLRFGKGAAISLNSNTSFFAELLYTGTTYRGAASGISEYRVNGLDQRNYFLGLDANRNNVEALDRAKTIDPMKSATSGSVMLNVGIQFRLGSASK